MTNRNYINELKEQRKKDEQEIKKMLEFYKSSTKIIAKLSDIETNGSLKSNYHVKYRRWRKND